MYFAIFGNLKNENDDKYTKLTKTRSIQNPSVICTVMLAADLVFFLQTNKQTNKTDNLRLDSNI